MARKAFIPQVGERALILGMTGSGKTAFASWLLIRIPTAPIIIMDTKDEPKFEKLPANVIVETMEQAQKAAHDVRYDYIIVRPPVEMLGHPHELDRLLYFAYLHLHHCVIYIDEIYSFHSNGRAGPGLIALYTRGRSKGITTICSSQKPKFISSFVMSESQRYYIFRLQDIKDRKRVGEVISDFEDLPLPPKHGFYYYEIGEEAPELFKPIALDPAFDTGYVDVRPEEPSSDPGETPASVSPHVWI